MFFVAPETEQAAIVAFNISCLNSRRHGLPQLFNMWLSSLRMTINEAKQKGWENFLWTEFGQDADRKWKKINFWQSDSPDTDQQDCKDKHNRQYSRRSYSIRAVVFAVLHSLALHRNHISSNTPSLVDFGDLFHLGVTFY